MVATSPTQRDQHVLAVDAHGRMNWQKTTGYNRRSKVEASIGRYKRVIGDTLKSRDDARRVTEVAIAIKSLNRMRQLGQAVFLRASVYAATMKAARTMRDHAPSRPTVRPFSSCGDAGS
jgi:hypothetical protein